MIKPYQNTLENEMDNVSNAVLKNASRMVIYSHGVTIQHGLTYPMTAIATRNVGHTILLTPTNLMNTTSGTSTNSDKRSLTSYTGGIRKCENSRITNYKNC